jgi:hypothetical protein
MLRNRKSFSNSGVPRGREAKGGPGRKKRKNRKQQSGRQSSRIRGAPPVIDTEVDPIEEDPIEEEEPVWQMILHAQGKVRCLAFGKYRCTLYPVFFLQSMRLLGEE